MLRGFFFTCFHTPKYTRQVERCQKIFQMYDADGGGRLDKEEFEVLFTVLRYPKQFSEEELDSYFLKFDMDEDGELDEDRSSLSFIFLLPFPTSICSLSGVYVDSRTSS